jgi:hypothetical protein
MAALACGLSAACQPPPASHASPLAEASPLHVAPLAGLVAAAGLRWLVDVRPRTLLASRGLIALVPEAELDAFARTAGGVDLRGAEEVVVARAGTSLLALARQFVDPSRVEVAFSARLAEVEGRAIEGQPGVTMRPLTRVWGRSGRERQSLVLFGNEAAGIVFGADAPIRVAEAYALGRLRRAPPAWEAPPLDALGAALGDAPLRAAAPGPFEGEWSAGLGGLLAGATAVGAAARLEGDTTRVTVVVMGPWGERAPDAQRRLERAVERLGTSDLGRLLGLDRPSEAPRLAAAADRVTLELVLRTEPLVRGLRDATAASATEMFGDLAHAAL